MTAARLPMTDADIVAAGKDTLLAEGRALTAGAQRLGPTFVSAVRLIASTRGKIVLTGLGKSGHIARKIASTFASTGSSSFYLHPSEARHGDFGMISEGDCLVAIAFRGETAEVIDVVKFARRRGVSVLSITGFPSSSLAELSDIHLDGSIEREACPLNLAPSASSTLALSLGDALALTVMQLKGFSSEDFARLHPGGSIGQRLLRVRDLMRKKEELCTLRLESSFQEVIEGVTRGNFGIAAVVDASGALAGAVTDGDLRRALLKHGPMTFSMRASDFMSKAPRTIADSDRALDAMTVMEGKLTTLFVVNDIHKKNLVGFLRLHDLLVSKIV